MTYTITLTTQDNQQLSFSCELGQTVQEAAEAASFFLPALCNAGSCGACMGYCVTGKYHLGSYTPSLLPGNHQQTGEVLFCRTYPDSDLQLTTFYTSSQIKSSRQQAREAEIIKLELISERTVLLVLQLWPNAQQSLAFEFQPGQFVELEVPEMQLKRAYSIANSPNETGRLAFLIRLQPHGQFSSYLQQAAKVGDYLHVEGPSGTFVMNTQSPQPRCFVAGGTGIAPFLSMLQQMAEWGESRPIRLFWGVTNEREIFYQEQLQALTCAIPQLQIEICVWQPSESWTGFHGTPADALSTYLKESAILPELFLCGPPMLVEAATNVALEAGIKLEQIFCERF
jgi:ferredoxin-NADP reductase/ferredoxin